MKPIVGEWVAKAKADFATVERECRARKQPNHDGACFHAQQCAEKYLKAILTEMGVNFRKIHDLTTLLAQVVRKDDRFEVFREDLAFLSDFAVAFRYPGESADRESALDARRRCRRFRRTARSWLRLDGKTNRDLFDA